jgi:hypothetical protein
MIPFLAQGHTLSVSARRLSLSGKRPDPRPGGISVDAKKAYRIELVQRDEGHLTAMVRLFPTSEAITAGKIGKEDAEEAFEKLQDLDTYLAVCKQHCYHGDEEGTLYPLVLTSHDIEDEGDDDEVQYWQTEELDRFEPGIIFDGEAFDLDAVTGSNHLDTVVCGSRDWYLFSDSETAGKAVAKYWKDMAYTDRREFACIIGEERLVQWALGESDSFGISSLDDFFEVAADHPEEHWASYDGDEIEVDGASLDVQNEIGYMPTVAYRHN